MFRTGDIQPLARAGESRSPLAEWRVALGRGLALWGSLGALAYRLILWQDTGEWLPLTLHTAFGLRIDLGWLGLSQAALWLTGLPVEAWFLTGGGLLLLIGRRSGD